jgi:cyanophycin synthetase
MRETLADGCEPVFFSMDPDHPVVRAHCDAGGRAAVLHDGSLTWCEGRDRRALVAPERLPFTLDGHARYNVANALAALAAATCMGYQPAAIVSALEDFVSDAKQNPLRTNRFDIDGATLIVDYAHNVVAYRALCETARSLIDGGAGRLIGVVTSPGDRRASDLHDVGRVCGEFFDELFVYEQDPRGRAAGETVEAILAGSRAAAGAKPLHGIPPIRDALASGLATSRPGDVVVFTCAGTLDDLVEGVRRAAPRAAPAIAEAVGLPA